MFKKELKIVLCGHYGATNIGDEAIGLSLVQKIKKEAPKAKIVVLSYNPVATQAFYAKYFPKGDVKSVYLMPFGFRSFVRGLLKGEIWRTLKEIRSCDQFVLGGGGLFTDERLFAVFLWAFQTFWAYFFKKPVVMVGQSVGPLKTKIARFITHLCFSRAKMIYVRDRESKNLLKNIGVDREIFVTCDPVLGLKFSKKNQADFVLSRLNKKIEQKGYFGYFIFSIRPWMPKFEKLYKNFIQLICLIGRKNKLLPVFIPFQLIKENDQEVLNKLIVQNRDFKEIEMLKFNDDIFKILSVISKANFTIGVRLHSLIFSVLMNVPCMAFIYSPKVENFMKDLGLEKYILKPENLKNMKNLEKFDDFDLMINNSKKQKCVYLWEKSKIVL
jgi:polysaccharide pyruvyl transferase WcaK-like protein